MTRARGRTSIGPALRRSATSVALTLIAATSGCARPGTTAPGTPTAESRSLRVEATSYGRPVPRIDSSMMTRRPDGGVDPSCATPPEPWPAPQVSGSQAVPAQPDAAVTEALERRRRNLEAQNPPTPTRGAVLAAAIAGAESCVRALRIEFTLLAAGSGTRPSDDTIRATLRHAGLTSVTVQPGPTFAASTGQACLLGSLTTEKPSFTIAQLGPDGSCHP